jgi:hypothetical protein
MGTARRKWDLAADADGEPAMDPGGDSLFLDSIVP